MKIIMEILSECTLCYEELVVDEYCTCVYCDVQTCHECFQKCIADMFDYCYNCKTSFTYSSLTSIMSPGWTKKIYKQLQFEKYLEEEKGTFPLIMDKIVIEKRITQLSNDISDYRRLADMLSALKYFKETNPDLIADVINVDSDISLDEKIRGINTKTNILYIEYCSIYDRNTSRVIKYVMKCSADCEGLVDSTSMKCCMCDTKYCRSCYEVKNKKHVCDEDTVECIKFIKSDTKPCPKCANRIHRSKGCDQMWCTGCKTAFSWSKGTIERGNIHNPHAIAWLKEGNLQRDIGDIPCGGLPPIYLVLKDVQRRGGMKKYLEKYYIMCAELIDNTRRGKYYVKIEHNTTSTHTKFLMNKISKEKWLKSMRNFFNKKLRGDIIRQVQLTLTHLFIERFRLLAETHNKVDKNELVGDLIDDMEKVIKLHNKTITEELRYIGCRSKIYMIKISLE